MLDYYYFPFGSFFALSGFAMLACYFVIFVLPFVLILRKAGYSALWIVIAFIPVLNFIFLWVFALSRWPVEYHVTRNDP